MEDELRFQPDDAVVDSITSPNCSLKQYSKTAIPEGYYQVVVGPSFFNKPTYKRKLPRLQNVPCFEGILIHGGKKPTESAGCIGICSFTTGKVVSHWKDSVEEDLTNRLAGEPTYIWVHRQILPKQLLVNAVLEKRGLVTEHQRDAFFNTLT